MSGRGDDAPGAGPVDLTLAERIAGYAADPSEHHGVFAGGDFPDAAFHGAMLADADFRGAVLDRAVFDNAHCENAQFGRAAGEHGPGPGGQLRDARFHGAHLTGAAFHWASLERACFDEARAEGAHFVSSGLEHASFRNAKLRGAAFHSTSVRHADFDGADLREVEGLLLDDCSTRGVVFDPRGLDPWTKLRQTYTGPKFTLYFVLFAVFIAVLGVKAFLYAAAVVTPAVGGLLAGAGPPALETVPLVSLLSGWYAADTGSRLFIAATIAYNLLRFLITLVVAQLRDAADATGRTPHRWAPRQSHSEAIWSIPGHVWRSYHLWYELHLVLVWPLGLVVWASGVWTVVNLLFFTSVTIPVS